MGMIGNHALPFPQTKSQGVLIITLDKSILNHRAYQPKVTQKTTLSLVKYNYDKFKSPSSKFYHTYEKKSQ